MTGGFAAAFDFETGSDVGGWFSDVGFFKNCFEISASLKLQKNNYLKEKKC